MYIANMHKSKKMLAGEMREKLGFAKVKDFIANKFGIWDFWDIFPYKWSSFYYNKIKPFLKPGQKRLRNSIPKAWADTRDLIIDLNFEMIKIFYEEEYTEGVADWHSDESRKKFAKWLENSYKYITVDRPQLQKDLSNAYPPTLKIEDMFERISQEDGTTKIYLKNDGVSYDTKYAEVIRIEKLINQKDTKALTEMIKKRDFFWI
jgi:hypothetical protein